MYLTFNAPIATKVVCFSRLLKCLRSLYVKSVDPDQTLFASILNSSVMLAELENCTRPLVFTSGSSVRASGNCHLLARQDE